MLQGSIDTLGIADVLRLLAATSKTGELRVTGDRGAGSVTVHEGRLVKADSAESRGGASLDEVVFDLFRFETGQFVFSLDEVAPEGETHDVEAVLDAAGGRLDDYRAIAQVVPSLDHLVAPVDLLPQEHVQISADEWTVLRTIGDGSPVSAVGRALDLGEVEASRAVKNLVDRELAIVTAPDPDAYADVVEAPIDVAVDVPAVPGFDAPLTTPPTPVASAPQADEPPAWAPAVDEPLAPTPSEDLIGDDPMAEAAMSAEETAAALDAATAIPSPTAAPQGFSAPAETVDAPPAFTEAPVAEIPVEEPAAEPEVASFRPPVPPPPPAAGPETYQNAQLEDVAPPAPTPETIAPEHLAPEAMAAAPEVEAEADLPPSPAEIDAFGSQLTDPSSLAGEAPAAPGFGETPGVEAAPEAVAEPTGFVEQTEATPATEDAEDDHALLMRYLRAEG